MVAKFDLFQEFVSHAILSFRTSVDLNPQTLTLVVVFLIDSPNLAECHIDLLRPVMAAPLTVSMHQKETNDHERS